jgi:hypothetical protein
MSLREKQMTRRVSPQRKRAFLEALANIDDTEKDVQWLLRQFPGFFAPNFVDDNCMLRAIADMKERLHEPALSEIERHQESHRMIMALRNRVRVIWLMRENRAWMTTHLRRFAPQFTYHPSVSTAAMSRTFEQRPPVPDALQQAILYIESRTQLTRHCVNPDCKTPYFFAAPGKPNQKACSTNPCGVAWRKAKKQRWWEDHGTDWREKRKGKKSAKTKRSKR